MSFRFEASRILTALLVASLVAACGGSGSSGFDGAVTSEPEAIAKAIAEAAQYRGADLIVMSSHGRSGLERLMLGSVAETVLRTTDKPVFLVRPGSTMGEASPVFAGVETADV